MTTSIDIETRAAVTLARLAIGNTLCMNGNLYNIAHCGRASNTTLAIAWMGMWLGVGCMPTYLLLFYLQSCVTHNMQLKLFCKFNIAINSLSIIHWFFKIPNMFLYFKPPTS